MKPTNTPIKGRPQVRKKAAAKKQAQAAPAKVVKASEGVTGKGKGKKPAGDEEPAKAGRSPRTRIRPGAAKTPEEPSARRKASPGGKSDAAKKGTKSSVRKMTAKEKKQETGRGGKAAKKSAKVRSADAAPRTKRAKASSKPSGTQKTVRAGGAGSAFLEVEEKAPLGRRPAGISEIVTPELPEEYGEDEFFLIPVEPRVVYASWEITKDSLAGEKGRLGVRFLEVTGGKRGEPKLRSFLDVDIPKRVGDAFFNIGIHGREIIAEIGSVGPDGHFKRILGSRKVLIPSALGEDDFSEGARLPGKDGYGSRRPHK